MKELDRDLHAELSHRPSSQIWHGRFEMSSSGRSHARVERGRSRGFPRSTRAWLPEIATRPRYTQDSGLILTPVLSLGCGRVSRPCHRQRPKVSKLKHRETFGRQIETFGRRRGPGRPPKAKSTTPTGRRKRTKITAEVRDKVKAILAKGNSMNAVSKQLAISYIVIKKISDGVYDKV